MPETPLFKYLKKINTEKINPATTDIDLASTRKILEMINAEDKMVALAIEEVIDDISNAVDAIVLAFKNGGRLIYVGAGTSGRLGIIDAAECPPTFGTEHEMIQAIIAGGEKAIFKAQEGAEDSFEQGAISLQEKKINSNDIVCGIAASGRTPFVLGAINYANQLGCKTIFITTVDKTHLDNLVLQNSIIIAPQTGPEVITGSTRMKSGTAQKLVLNMLTTASMVLLGKTYGNIMVDLQQTNNKLVERSKKILMEITGCDYDTAQNTLEQANGKVKIALFMLLTGSQPDKAELELEKANGFIRKALNNY